MKSASIQLADRKKIKRQRREREMPQKPTAKSNSLPYFDFQAKIVRVPLDALRASTTKVVKNEGALAEGAARAVGACGAIIPIVAHPNGEVVVGSEYIKAYRDLGYDTAPVIYTPDLSDRSVRALRLALRRLGQMVEFDQKILADEFNFILTEQPDLIRMTPFDMAQVDQCLAIAALIGAIPDDDDNPLPPAPKCSQLGDRWDFSDGSCLKHGDSCVAEQVADLFRGRHARQVVADPPYGTKIKGVVSQQHGEFVQGSDVSETEIQDFFLRFISAMSPHLLDGCMIDAFTDFRSLYALLSALREADLDLKSMCVWDKGTPGMGAPFRHVLEYVTVSKFGTAPHVDNIKLGKHGRNRSTLWWAPGNAGFNFDREESLRRHPTPKPVGLIAEAILDFSEPGDIVFDPFIGSGTTLVAAYRMKRVGYGMELDGSFVDAAVLRMEKCTGQPARLASTGQTFAELAAQRSGRTASLSRTRTRAEPEPSVEQGVRHRVRERNAGGE